MVIYEKRVSATIENAAKIMKEQDDFMSRVSVNGTVLVRELMFGRVEYVYISDIPPDEDSWDSDVPLEDVNRWSLLDDDEIKYLEWDFDHAVIYAKASSIDCIYRVETDV